MAPFDPTLDQGRESVWGWGGMRAELVAKLVAVVASGDNVAAMLAPVLLGHQVLSRGLQPGRLAQGQAVRNGKARAVCEPHREGAVVATP